MIPPTNTSEGRKAAPTAPQRIQRKRTKGFKMPEGAKYVGRGSAYGNPYVIQVAPKGMVGASPQTDHRYAVVDTRPNAPRGNYQLFKTFHDAASYATAQYRYVVLPDLLAADLHTLAGHDLACWCLPENPCHGSVLLEFANKGELKNGLNG